MVKALVSIDADLASSIALRFTCQLAKLVEVEIQTIHIHEPETGGAGGAVMGAGWARHTYEKELIQEAKKGITQLLTAESGFCPVLNKPIILYGDREKEILDRLQKGGYDIFVEGMPFQFSSKTLGRHLKSHLYQHLPVPALLVQNLLPLRKLLLLVEGSEDYASLFGAVAALFKGVDLEVDILFRNAEKGADAESFETLAGKVGENYGWKIGKIQEMPERPELMGAEVDEWSLVATFFERQPKGKAYTGPLVEFLGSVSCPILFYWR
jgi:hypothetical protein